MVAAYIILLSTLSILRHNAFASNFDLGNMDQTVWNTVYGDFFSLTAGEETVSRLSIHADFILILLSPFYLIWNDVRVLLISESVALALGAIPTFFLALKVLKNRFQALCIAFVYLANPALQWIDIYDFHGVAFAIPTLLSAFYFAYIKKWKWYFLFAFLALLTKEQISLYLVMLSLVIFFVFKAKKVALITFFVSIFWFLVMFFVAIPQASPEGEHWALGWLKVSGGSQTDPWEMLRYIRDTAFSATTFDYLYRLTRPFGFLPVLGFPWFFLSLPELSINLLSTQAQMRSTRFHYHSAIVPTLIIATIFGLSYVSLVLKKLKLKEKYIRFVIYLFIIYLMAAAIRVNYNRSPLPSTPSCWCFSYQVSKADIEFEKILQEIPENASVAASGNVRPHISHRKFAYNLPGGVEKADYIAILTEERIIGGHNKLEFETNLVKKLNESKNFQLVKNTGDFYLFKRL